MRLVIDMQGAQTASRTRGIGRYTSSFVNHLITTSGSHTVHLVLNGTLQESAAAIRDDYRGLLDNRSISAWYAPSAFRWCDSPGNNAFRTVASRLRAYSFARLKPDIAHTTSLFEGFGDSAFCMPLPQGTARAQTTVFYDAIPKLFPYQYLSDPLYASFYESHGTALGSFDHVLAISETAVHEAIKWFGVRAERLTDVGAAADDCFQPIDVDRERDLHPLGITKPFILYTGGFDQRKNLPRLIEAFGHLPSYVRHIYQLVIAGKCEAPIAAELRRVASTKGVADDSLVLTGYVRDATLQALYSACAMSILPSWHEGFGLPVLEAMKCGAVVLGSRTGAIAELITDESALFDPLSSVDIAATIERYHLSEDLRRDARARGLRRAQEYSWRTVACKAWQTWETILDELAAPIRRPTDASDRVCVQSLAVELSCHPAIRQRDLADIATAISRTESSRTDIALRHLFIDISELSQRDARTGVQRVTRSILNQLLQHPPAGFVISPVCASTSTPGYRYATAYTHRLVGVGDLSIDDQLVEPSSGDVFLGLDLQHHVVLAQKPWLDWANAHGVSIYFVIYDLLPLYYPDCFPPGTKEGHHAWLDVVTSYDGVVCISRTVACEVSEWLRSTPRRRTAFPQVKWFHLGSDIENSAPTTGVPAEINTSLQQWKEEPTFLMVGTVEPRKGHADVLDAFDILWGYGISVNLVIVGKPGWHIESLATRINDHPQHAARLFWLRDASDELLQAAYTHATALLAFSRGEGFGLPLIEAAQHGIPIIARDIPIFREVAGEHAWYVKSEAPSSLANALTQWLEAQRSREVPNSADLTRLTWAESTSQLLDAMGIQPPKHDHLSVVTRAEET
jgi:glycosyltransferase involved in cell wall biosynthesis